MRSETEAELFQAARTDPAAFARFYRRHSAAIVRFAARRAPSPDAVVDLAAAVWLEVVTSIDRFDPSRGEPLPWILGIAAMVGRVTDAAGRPGVAVAYTHEGVRQELVFDPRTASLLGERYVLVGDSSIDIESGGPGAIYGMAGPAGTVAFTATYLASGVVDSVRDRG